MKRQQSAQVEHVNAWSRDEVSKLLEVARERAPEFFPLLAFLIYTGCRKGEAQAVKWEDVDWYGSRIVIRRSLSAHASQERQGGIRGALSCPRRDPPQSALGTAQGISQARLVRRSPLDLPLRNGRVAR